VLFRSLLPLLKTARAAIQELRISLENMLEQAETGSGGGEDDDEGGADDSGFAASLLREIRSSTRRLGGAEEVLREYAVWCAGSDEDDNNIYWLERRRGRGIHTEDYTAFTITPLDVAPLLAKALFSVMQSTVCVSATLCVGKSFDFWAGRTGAALAEKPAGDGAAGKKILSGVYPSPFPYAERVLLAVPGDGPEPNNAALYRAFCGDAVTHLVLASGGGALVLFTSFDMLRSAYEAASGSLEDAGIRCLRQGDDERSRLLKVFTEDESSTLFATDSFWEGIDVPGRSLRSVIICRLPFKSPGDPVFSARCEALDASGASSFMALSVPEAVMKFRQGFGRLVRRADDGGVVTVLDRRVISKPYGRIFLASLPPTKKCVDSLENVLSVSRRFWENL
jgi:ATP-dependent DNA helicase DinG